MEGKRFEARGGRRVLIDDEGIDLYSRRLGGMRVPWAAVIDVRISTPQRPDSRRCLTARLVDERTVSLPAPIGSSRHAERFEAQAREILEAYKVRGAGLRVSASGEPQDGIPVEYRLEALELIDEYAGPSRLVEFVRPGALALLVLLVLGLVGLGGSIHAYTRDLAVYDAYRAAAPCSAPMSVNGYADSAYCIVTDGVAEEPVGDPFDNIYSLSVGPSLQSMALPAGSPDLPYDGPVQYAFFATDQPALDGLQQNDPVEYIAANGGDVASVTLDGITYQTLDSPRAQHVYDCASLSAAAGFTLLFACWLGLRVARRRVLGPWAVPLLTIIAGIVTNLVVDTHQTTSRPLGSGSSLLELTGFVMLAAAVAFTGLWVLPLRRLMPRPVSRRHRARP